MPRPNIPVVERFCYNTICVFEERMKTKIKARARAKVKVRERERARFIFTFFHKNKITNYNRHIFHQKDMVQIFHRTISIFQLLSDEKIKLSGCK
jgi:hypothetical protein